MEGVLQPTDVKTQHTAETTASLPCAICRRQFSKYTCPHCNIPYCSLTCYRSEAHANCSETFYRKELESDIRGDKSKSAEERQKTLEMLKRFEEDSMNDELVGLDEADEDEDGNDLESRLGGLDIDAASYEDLWTALTPAERERFTKALQDPNSELAQQLLSSEELEKVRVEPWWEAPQDAVEAGPSSVWREQKRYGKRPAMIEIPERMAAAPPAPGKLPLLLYNICAIMVTYAYITRYFATSPLADLDPSERKEARRIVSQLVPLLTDHLSKTVHPTLPAAVTDLLSRFEPGAMPLSFFSALLKDAAALLLPSTVVALPEESTAPRVQSTSETPSASSKSKAPAAYSNDLSCHPSAHALLALSDLSTLFTADSPAASRPGVAGKAKPNHVAHKLTFYAAYILGVPPVLLRTLVAELAERAEIIAREDAGSVGEKASARAAPGPEGRSRVPDIVELS